MLEKVPPIVQHALLLLVPPLLVFVVQDLVPALRTTNPHLAEIVAAVASLVALIFTPLSRDYGVGGPASPPAPKP